jgi:HEPN domain-containing protein
MSDARQAISVAKAAGAQEFAGDDLQEAETSLESAQKKLNEGAYSQARYDALRARDKALEALSIAERAAPRAK